VQVNPHTFVKCGSKGDRQAASCTKDTVQENKPGITRVVVRLLQYFPGKAFVIFVCV
jgi:hypothetical protein